jgi:hypothetical protein
VAKEACCTAIKLRTKITFNSVEVTGNHKTEPEPTKMGNVKQHGKTLKVGPTRRKTKKRKTETHKAWNLNNRQIIGNSHRGKTKTAIENH